MINKLVIISLIFISLFYISCSEKVDINAEHKDTPIIYCVLDPSTEYQYVKVNKSFLGKDRATDLAQNSSLLFYNNVKVTLKEIKNGNNTRQWVFDKVEIPKEDGVFATDKNIIYSKKIDFGNVNQDAEYELLVEINDGENAKHTVKSKTKLITGGAFTQPSSANNIASIRNYKGDYIYKFYAGYQTNLYQTVLEFHYLEVRGNDTVYKTITIPSAKSVIVNYRNSELQKSISIDYFYKTLVSNIPSTDATVKRLARMPCPIELHLTSVDENYYTYSQVTAPSNGIVQHKPTFSNLYCEGGEDAYGLFASRNNIVQLVKLNKETIDTLERGIYTKNLRFAPRIGEPYYQGHFSGSK